VSNDFEKRFTQAVALHSSLGFPSAERKPCVLTLYFGPKYQFCVIAEWLHVTWFILTWNVNSIYQKKEMPCFWFKWKRTWILLISRNFRKTLAATCCKYFRSHQSGLAQISQ